MPVETKLTGGNCSRWCYHGHHCKDFFMRNFFYLLPKTWERSNFKLELEQTFDSRTIQEVFPAMCFYFGRWCAATPIVIIGGCWLNDF